MIVNGIQSFEKKNLPKKEKGCIAAGPNLQLTRSFSRLRIGLKMLALTQTEFELPNS
jgi:hypothetical protein